MKKSKLILCVFIFLGFSFAACKKENIRSDQPEENHQIIKKASINTDEKVFEAKGIPPLPEEEIQRLSAPKPYQSQPENFYKESNPEDLK